MSVTDRSEALIELLSEFDEGDRQYVLVGGYAVSAFDTRFSTDLDAVTPPLRRGDEEALREHLERGREILAHDSLGHGFRNDVIPRRSVAT